MDEATRDEPLLSGLLGRPSTPTPEQERRIVEHMARINFERLRNSAAPAPPPPPPRSVRSERARGLLLRLLPPEYRAEFERFNSFRVWVNDSMGLPVHQLELGLACQGFIVFNGKGQPSQVRNVDMVMSGDWCAEDRLIAIWLRYRRDGSAFVESCCTGGFAPEDWRRIVARTLHL